MGVKPVDFPAAAQPQGGDVQRQLLAEIACLAPGHGGVLLGADDVIIVREAEKSLAPLKAFKQQLRLLKPGEGQPGFQGQLLGRLLHLVEFFRIGQMLGKGAPGLKSQHVVR